MLDKKINETIDQLIKKIKENNLGSIKFSNKTNCIEISKKYGGGGHHCASGFVVNSLSEIE